MKGAQNLFLFEEMIRFKNELDFSWAESNNFRPL